MDCHISPLTVKSLPPAAAHPDSLAGWASWSYCYLRAGIFWALSAKIPVLPAAVFKLPLSKEIGERRGCGSGPAANSEDFMAVGRRPLWSDIQAELTMQSSSIKRFPAPRASYPSLRKVTRYILLALMYCSTVLSLAIELGWSWESCPWAYAHLYKTLKCDE